MNKSLASLTPSAHTSLAGVNPPVEIGLSFNKADIPPPSGFFSSVISLFALPLWWACSGGHLVCAVFLVNGRPTPLHACHPDWSLGCGLLNPKQECTYHA
jgi:hypothetical protein